MTHSLIQFASASFFPPAIALVTIVRVAPSPPPSSSPPPLQAARVRDTTATPATAPSTFFLLMVVLHDRSDGFWAGRHAGAPRWRTEQLPLHGRPPGRGPLSPRRHVRRCCDDHQSTTHMSGRQALTSCQSRLVDEIRRRCGGARSGATSAADLPQQRSLRGFGQLGAPGPAVGTMAPATMSGCADMIAVPRGEPHPHPATSATGELPSSCD